jgi:hypothetical protein
MFEIGDKVVCTQEPPIMNGRTYPKGVPKKGRLYVVQGIFLDPTGALSIFLVGPQSLIGSGRDCGWRAWRFRKLSDIQQENRVFRSMKTSAKESARIADRYFPKL